MLMFINLILSRTVNWSKVSLPESLLDKFFGTLPEAKADQ